MIYYPHINKHKRNEMKTQTYKETHHKVKQNTIFITGKIRRGKKLMQNK